MFTSDGCYYEKILDTKDLYNGQKISKIILLNGKVIDFSNDQLGYAVVKDNKIESFNANGDIVSFQLNEIKILYYKEKSSNTDLLFISGLISTILIVFFFIYKNSKVD